jgi:hypothetical protein
MLRLVSNFKDRESIPYNNLTTLPPLSWNPSISTYYAIRIFNPLNFHVHFLVVDIPSSINHYVEGVGKVIIPFFPITYQSNVTKYMVFEIYGYDKPYSGCLYSDMKEYDILLGKVRVMTSKAL